MALSMDSVQLSPTTSGNAGTLIQVYQDDWGPRNLSRKMFYLACDGRADQTLPMTEVIVFLKDAPRETDPEILAFRKELEDLPDVRVFRFANEDEMRQQLLKSSPPAGLRTSSSCRRPLLLLPLQEVQPTNAGAFHSRK